MDFYSPKYPDLQFIDLPGFTKVKNCKHHKIIIFISSKFMLMLIKPFFQTNVGDQAKDIEQQVLNLVLKYMKDPNAIILAINDSTQDIGASEALKYAEMEDVDPKGERTIGVLTKLDKLEPGSDTRRVISYIGNETKPLALGYIGVVNRSQQQIDRNVDIETALQNEEDIINKQEFRRVHNRLGINYLRRFLTVILAQKMKELLPGLRKDSIEELKLATEQLGKLGNADDATTNYDDRITLLVERSIQNIRTILQGFTVEVNTENVELGARMNETIKQGVVLSAKEAREFYTIEEFHSKLSKAIQNCHAIRDQMMPVELVLDCGVRLLAENYR